MAEIIQLKNKSTGEIQHPKTTTDAVSHNNTSLPSVLDAKQAKLVEGDNITLTPKADGTVEISASGGGGSVDIINDLTSDRTDAALAAAQGKALDAKITQLSSEVGKIDLVLDQINGEVI